MTLEHAMVGVDNVDCEAAAKHPCNYRPAGEGGREMSEPLTETDIAGAELLIAKRAAWYGTQFERDEAAANLDTFAQNFLPRACAELRRLQEENCNLHERLKIPHPARDLANEANDLLAVKQQEIARLAGEVRQLRSRCPVCSSLRDGPDVGKEGPCRLCRMVWEMTNVREGLTVAFQLLFRELRQEAEAGLMQALARAEKAEAEYEAREATGELCDWCESPLVSTDDVVITNTRKGHVLCMVEEQRDRERERRESAEKALQFMLDQSYELMTECDREIAASHFARYPEGT